MDLRQLSYFIQVTEFRSFTKAAAFLGVAQSALSRQIRDLEAELGVALLLRNGRGVVPTDAGTQFLLRAKDLFESAERAKEEMRALKGRPMGIVSLGFPPAIGAILVVPLVERLRSRYPEIHLQLTEGYSAHIHEWLLSGRLDIGIAYDTHPTRALAGERLIKERLYLFGGAGSLTNLHREIRFVALKDLPLILPARPHAIRQLVDSVSAKLNLGLELSLEVSAFAAIRNLVVSGQGLTILPIAPLLSEIRAGTVDVVSITEPVLSQVVGMLISTHHPTSLASKAVARTVREVAKELSANGAWPADLASHDRGG